MPSTLFDVRYAIGPNEVRNLDTAGLRQQFLISEVFAAGAVRWTYSHHDRFMAGGAVPLAEPLSLEPVDPLKAAFFLERRELGIINIGGPGFVELDGARYELNCKEALYAGRGTRQVLMGSRDPGRPARLYLNSVPAHQGYPSRKVTLGQAEQAELGSLETANHRRIFKLLVHPIVNTCQLQMGMTELKPGSVWNTMPAHTHGRRMEVYLYFELPEGQAVCHFMGEPQQTRPLWVHNEQAVISPPWSIHAGAGTNRYTFIWGMAGENLDYDDMDKCPIPELR